MPPAEAAVPAATIDGAAYADSGIYASFPMLLRLPSCAAALTLVAETSCPLNTHYSIEQQKKKINETNTIKQLNNTHISRMDSSSRLERIGVARSAMGFPATMALNK